MEGKGEHGLIEIDPILKICTCPKTGKVFRHPVSVGDGHVYEQSYVNDWITKNGFVSPITKKKILNYTIVIQLRAFLNDLFEKYPHLENLRFEMYKVKWTIPHTAKEANEFIKKGDWKRLRECEQIDISNVGYEAIIHLLNSWDAFVHAVDHCVDLEAPVDQYKWTIMNRACRAGLNKQIRYLISKGANVCHNCPNDGWSPIKQYFSAVGSRWEVETVEAMVGAGADLYAKCNSGKSGIDMFFSSNSGKSKLGIIPYINPELTQLSMFGDSEEAKLAYEKRVLEWNENK